LAQGKRDKVDLTDLLTILFEKQDKYQNGSYVRKGKGYELQRSAVPPPCSIMVEDAPGGGLRAHLQARQEGSDPVSDRCHPP